MLVEIFMPQSSLVAAASTFASLFFEVFLGPLQDHTGKIVSQVWCCFMFLWYSVVLLYHFCKHLSSIVYQQKNIHCQYFKPVCTAVQLTVFQKVIAFLI